MKRLTALCLALISTAACMAEPNPPTVSAGDVDRAFAQARRLSALPRTATVDLPRGAVTYDGHIGADLRGDVTGSLLADMTMIVGFDDNSLRGDIRNINLIDPDGTPDQRMGGSLQVIGAENAGLLTAIAGGQVTAVDGQGNILDADMTLDMLGTVRDDWTAGDTVFGTVDGQTTGDLYLLIDGVYFAVAR